MKRLKLQAGSNLVEFALVLPLLLILVFGIIDFGFALYDKAIITNAAREAARFGIVYADPRPGQTAIENVAKNYLSGRLVNFQTSLVTVTAAPGVNSGDLVSVQVHYTYHPVVISKLIPSLGSFAINASSVMRSE
jgi:Flp pilus assembly protein TadG